MQRIFLAGIVLALTSGLAMAQTPPALTLDDCLRIALSENPTVKVADMEIERLDYSKKEVIGQLLPSIDFGANYNRMVAKQTMYMNMDAFGGGAGGDSDNNPDAEASQSRASGRGDGGIKVGLDNSYSMGFTGSLPLIAPQLWKSLQISDAQILRSYEAARQSRQQLVNQVKSAYYALLLANDSRKVIQQSYDMAALTYATYSSQHKLGTASDYDVLRTSVAMKNIEPQLAQAGQTLVTLDSSNSDQIRINLEQIEREYNRAVQLLEIGGGTQQAVDQLKAQLDAAKSQYANIQENTVLRSPITGVVTARNYDPGDMSGNLPVLTVGQLSPVVKVLVNISENDMADIVAGQPVNISLDAFPEETFSGKVYRVYPTVDPATRTFGVEIRIPNPGERLKPGMFARVTIDFGERQNVVVPDRAVVKQTGSGNKYVYVLHGNKVSYNRVELGRRIDNSYELIEGVADGDTVVITGQTRLADGVEVEVQ